MDVCVLIFISVYLIHGTYSSVADLQFCRDEKKDVLYTVNELYFYRYQSSVADPGKEVTKREVRTESEYTLCTCDIKPAEPLTAVRFFSQKKIVPCYNWISANLDKVSYNHTCQKSDTFIGHTGRANLTLRLTLYEGENNNYPSVIPLKITLVPTQSYLKVTCYAENVTAGSLTDVPVETSVFSTTSTAFHLSTTETTEQPSTSAPSSQANYTPLVIGIVAVALLAGTCVVCVVLCRTIRKREPDGPPERFHQTVHRKASNMLRVIKAKRPLPHLPQSLKRKFPVTIQQSGLYDSIRSKHGHDEGQTHPRHVVTTHHPNSGQAVTPNGVYGEHQATSADKPAVATQISNDSSLYIHPIDGGVGEKNDRNITKPSFNKVTDPTYLTTVIFHETNRKAEQINKTDTTDSDYMEPVSNEQKTESFNNTASLDKAKLESIDIDKTFDNDTQTNDTNYENLKNHPKAIKVCSSGSDAEYMSMGGMNERLTDSSKSDINQVNSEQHSTVIPGDSLKVENEYENSGAKVTDGVFPELFRFESLIEETEKKANGTSTDTNESGV